MSARSIALSREEGFGPRRRGEILHCVQNDRFWMCGCRDRTEPKANFKLVVPDGERLGRRRLSGFALPSEAQGTGPCATTGAVGGVSQPLCAAVKRLAGAELFEGADFDGAEVGGGAFGGDADGVVE